MSQNSEKNFPRLSEVLERERNWLALMGLGSVGVIAHNMQRSGSLYDLPSFTHAAGESMAHPMLGFAGALIGDAASHKPASNSRAKLMFVGALAVNFIAEFGQMMYTPQGSRYANFLAPRNLPETGKDAMFALAGGLIYTLLNRPKRGNSIDQP
jgi:hypothetical protein